MPTPTIRRHPRTLQEAFGPYTSKEILPMREPTHDGQPLAERLLDRLTPEGLFIGCVLCIGAMTGVLMLVGVIA